MEAFQLCTTALERWFDEADTDLDLTDSIVEYVRRRGTVTMEEAIIDAPPRFRHMALSQDTIGWRWFLEGMISTEITQIQWQYIAVNRLTAMVAYLRPPFFELRTSLITFRIFVRCQRLIARNVADGFLLFSLADTI